MPLHSRLSITLITGFLGSGKTTFLRKIVEASEFKSESSALLINDAGPVNIDAVIFRGKAKEIKALTGGCICCVNPHEMKAAVLEFSALPHITHLWIEASGLAETDELLHRLMDPPLPQKTEIRDIIHLIDAESFSKNRSSLTSQKKTLLLANRILIHKRDLVSSATLQKIILDLQTLSPQATIQTALHGEIDSPSPRLIPGTTPSSIPSSSLHAKTLWKTKWIPIPEPQTFEIIDQFLQSLPPEIYRAKGFIQIADLDNEIHLIQKVGPHAETIAWPYTGPHTEPGLVLLGRGDSIQQLDLSLFTKK